MVNIGWWVVGGGAPATMAAQTSSTAHRDMTVANAVRTTCPRLRCATGTSPTSSSSSPPPTYLYTASRFRSTLLASTSSALSTVPDYLHYLLPTSYSVCQHPACLTSRIPRRRHGVTELQTLQLYSTVCIPSLTCTTPRRGRGSWRAAFSAPQLVLT